MDETILPPSPNWFQVSGMVVTRDGWIVYGGPSKSLCLLEPFPADQKGVIRGPRYHAHVFNRAHGEKIVSVDISPEWPARRTILTGSADGSVKQWSLEKLIQTKKVKPMLSHEIHSQEREEIAGVSYSNEVFAVTVGCFGNIVKWDLNSNIVKSYKSLLRGFKPLCMACSPHIHLNVAVGTKQGVVFVLDLKGKGQVLYKVRGQDDEIINIGWCPQFEVALKKTLKESDKRLNAKTKNKEVKKQKDLKELLGASAMGKNLPEDSFDGTTSEDNIVQEDDMFDIYKDHAADEFGHKKYEPVDVIVKVPVETKDDYLAECLKLKEQILKNKAKDELSIQSIVNALDNAHVDSKVPESSSDSDKLQAENEGHERKVAELLEASSQQHNHPETSLDASTSEEIVVVPEDDMFDIYKDHEADEFGHKKYQPVEISVKVPLDTKDDYLAECLKLKEEIIKLKEQDKSSMSSLIDSLDRTHMVSQEHESSSSACKLQTDVDTKVCDNKVESSQHIHKHLLATVGKHSGVRIWSKTGKLISSCAIASNALNRNQKTKQPYWPTLLWYKPDVLLIADGKNQLLECNPLKIDCKNKLDWIVVHSLHKRAVYCIASNAPKVQTGKEVNCKWNVYTVSQDRNIIQYSIEKNEKIALIATSGGFIYTILPCPYDAGKMAVSVGDGAVRVWETSTLEDDETKLSPGVVTSYWQNVQGKVLVIAWHPTRENLLAFATAESRIGLLDVSGKTEKPAKVLPSALSGPIYSISWGEEYNLYACANGNLVVYNAKMPHENAAAVEVELESCRWAVSAVSWSARGLALGSAAGGAAVLAPRAPHQVRAAAVRVGKMIQMIEWHPQQTSDSTEESPYSNLLALCSSEKSGNIAILEYIDKEDGIKQLQTYKMLSGHKQMVLQVSWNPHREGQLLSTSQDNTVRIWDVVAGACVSIFGGHSANSIGAAWLAYPHLASTLLSGGGDCAARLWDATDYPSDAYDEVEVTTRREKKHAKKELKLKPEEENVESKALESQPEPEGAIAVKSLTRTSRSLRKKFMLPMLHRSKNRESLLHAARIMFQKHLEKTSAETDLKEKISSKIDSNEKGFSQRLLEKSSGSNHEDESDEEETYSFEYLKIFGSIKEVNEILDKQMESHDMMNNPEGWITLAIFRGHIDAMIQYASQRDLLCPYLLSIAPCVSYKYWKDVNQLYLAQIDRFLAKGDERKLEVSRIYGGAMYHKMAAHLSAHDVRGAVAALLDAHFYVEAYVLCRIRYMDSIAEEALTRWATERNRSGGSIEAAICYIVLGNLQEAATALGIIEDQECLDLAQDIARAVGQNMLAEHISEKKESMISSNQTSENKDEILPQLPSRVELLMKEHKVNGESLHVDATVNGNNSKEVPE